MLFCMGYIMSVNEQEKSTKGALLKQLQGLYDHDVVIKTLIKTL